MGDDKKGYTSASVTLFFALAATIIFALFLSILESARTEAGRLSLTIAANSSIDSLFSQYHRNLWSNYRLLGLEYYAKEQLSDEMRDFMEPYLEADNWFPARLESIDINDLVNITDSNGEIFETEVLDYMKYGIAAVIWDMADIEVFDSGITEGAALSEVSELYDDHSVAASDVELALEELAEIIAESEEEVSKALGYAESYDGTGFTESAESAIAILYKIPSAVEKYETRADALAVELAASRTELEQKRASGEIGDTVWEALDSDISEYESYADADGERRQQITALSAASEADAAYLEGLITEAREIMDYIASWEPEDEDDELDEAGLWEPLIADMRNYDHLSLGCAYGIEDRETEARLENASSRLGSELIKFVLPDGASVSSEALELDASPTAAHADAAESRLEILDRVYMAAYISSEFNYFGRGVYDEEDSRGTGGCEQEYIIYGNDNDYENLKQVIETLAGIRSGLNLVYLYTDSSKRQESLTLASAILGPGSITPLVKVLQFFIITTWALGQAVMDVRHLLAGGKVPFMHTSESFNLTLEGLLRLSSEDMSDIDTGTRDEGLSYADYLKILLFAGHDSTMDYRCMDMIQLSLCNTQSDFCMDNLAYSLNAEADIYALHLFSSLGLVKAYDSASRISESYHMTISTSYSY